MIAVFFALLTAPAWPYRGGSVLKWLPKWLRARPIPQIATPLFIGLAFLASAPFDVVTSFLIGAGAVAFVLASFDGWGRQMDLGRDGKPDDETGSGFRQWFFEKIYNVFGDTPITPGSIWHDILVRKSHFWRDLLGLYMRFAQYAGAAIIWGFAGWAFAVPAIFMVGLAPLAWVIEHHLYHSKGRYLGWAFSEWVTGSALAVLTLLVALSM